MRSEILGFNAPIRQKDGQYYYGDPYYSIMSISLTDSGLIEKIIKVLSKISTEVSHPELEILIERLTCMSGRKIPSENQEVLIEYNNQYQYKINGGRIRIPSKVLRRPGQPAIAKKLEEKDIVFSDDKGMGISFSLESYIVPTWGDVLGLIKLQ